MISPRNHSTPQPSSNPPRSHLPPKGSAPTPMRVGEKGTSGRSYQMPLQTPVPGPNVPSRLCPQVVGLCCHCIFGPRRKYDSTHEITGAKGVLFPLVTTHPPLFEAGERMIVRFRW